MGPYDEKAWLREMAERLRTQDNRITRDPIFVVQQRRRRYGVHPDWTDNIAWLNDGEEVDEVESSKLEASYDLTGEVPEDFTRTGYIDEWEFVQPFFTERGALDFIIANEHNLCDPRIFVDSAHRNVEWQHVRRLLFGDARAKFS